MRYALAILMLSLAILPVWALESAVPLSSAGSQVEETALGDLVADAVKDALKADAALVTAGSLRDVTIPKGAVREEQILGVLQYPNDRLAIIELTGEELTQALERSLSVHPQKNLGFLQVSGISLIFDPKAEKGKRISAVKVGDQPVKASTKYRIAVPEPLAKGGNGYFTVWGKGHTKDVSKVAIAEAVKQFLAGKKTLDYASKTRIKAGKA